MSSAKEEILARIGRALANSGPRMPEDRAREYETLPRPYRQAGTLDLDALLALFEDRLHDYNAVVYRCAEPQIAETIAQVLGARGKRGLVIADGLQAAWLPPGFTFPRDDGLSYDELDRAEGVLTGCAAAIAFTGTILLKHGPGEARRALTLVPDYHLCVVRAEQVVETVPEGIRRVSQFRTSPLTTISGPSATSDIEMTRVKGVHGPRTLDVVLVGG
ncbi:MAG TPA: LUD domain-containing protein [Bryobacteraceae bacterium]|nr:LUD domain-containing protein [Bryobacteraceae bacterium]